MCGPIPQACFECDPAHCLAQFGAVICGSPLGRRRDGKRARETDHEWKLASEPRVRADCVDVRGGYPRRSCHPDDHAARRAGGAGMTHPLMGGRPASRLLLQRRPLRGESGTRAGLSAARSARDRTARRGQNPNNGHGRLKRCREIDGLADRHTHEPNTMTRDLGKIVIAHTALPTSAPPPAVASTAS